MSVMKKKFGFYPSHLEIDAGPVKVRSLPELGTVVDSVLASNEVENGWIYAPLQPVQDFMSGEIRTYPYSARVFGLAKTHTIEHGAVTGEEHLEFHVWALSFFAGMRLTTTEAGFLDGTPLKPGSLVDFVLIGAELGQAIELAESFWLKNLDRPRNARLLVAAIHALFLGQYRQALQFEEFIHLYTAIDACYALTAALRRPKESFTHGERIEWMCDELGVRTPPWAKTACTRSTVISALRNDALHEALFVDEPLGFAVHGVRTGKNLTLEMAALVCRLLVALLGGKDDSYLSASFDTRQRQGLRLSHHGSASDR